MLGKVTCAYHECHLYAAHTCSIPEFIRNLASHFIVAPSLRAYSNIAQSSKDLLELVHNETSALLCSPIELFQRLIADPLNQIDETEPLDCLVIVVDAIEEAEFHRNENGESVAWLIKTCHKDLPKWVRWILSASNENSLPFASTEARSIWIDNELDERVARDMRLLIDYRIAVNPSVLLKFLLYYVNYMGYMSYMIVIKLLARPMFAREKQPAFQPGTGRIR